MSPEDMDSFIFCIASKRSAARLSKEMYDLNTYCPEKRPADKYDIPGSYFVMSEVSYQHYLLPEPVDFLWLLTVLLVRDVCP
jgi:Protein of unknown function (DUF1682)